VVRMPASWRGNRPPRPRVTGIVGGKPASGLGQEALLDFQMQVSLDGEALTPAEIQQLLAASDGLALVRGRWVELDREQLARMIERFREVERTAAASGLAFADAMRLLAGADASADDATVAAIIDWSQVIAGPWLAEALQGLRSPETLAQVNIDGRDFEVSAQQARVMKTVEAAFRSCGAIDGSFLEAPFYPGLYAFLRTRAPTWDIYYLWPRSDAVQGREIEILIQNRTSLVLVNKEASFDGKNWLKIGRTNPRLMQYISTEYVRTGTNLPEGFELYTLPGSCAQSVLSTM